jgi:hypothetical protein
VPVHHDDDGYGSLKEVAIDVTGSAPVFPSPGSKLGDVLKMLLVGYASARRLKVLDLGAGKLRNTIHPLRHRSNIHVWAVEYESLRLSSDQAHENYLQAQRFSRFHDVAFPHQFINSNETFDIILVINVIGIMPVPAERLLLLKYCFDRLKPNGELLWYSQHGEPDYAVGGARCNDRTRCGDGFYIGGNKYEKTFFREFDDYEVDEMMLAGGLAFDRSFSSSHNLARVYKKRPPAVLTSLLGIRSIEALTAAGARIPDPETPECRVVDRGADIHEVRPDIPDFQFDSLCVTRLRQITPGRAQATAFHRVAELILRRAFRGTLRKWEIEREIDEGRRRIDLLAANQAEAGFFDRARDHFRIHCPYVIIECKNYRDDVGNREMDQLAGRLNPKRGQLGVLVCRGTENRPDTLRRARDFLGDGKHIIVLTDEDLISLSNAVRDQATRDIDDLMEAKLDQLLL